MSTGPAVTRGGIHVGITHTRAEHNFPALYGNQSRYGISAWCDVDLFSAPRRFKELSEAHFGWATAAFTIDDQDAGAALNWYYVRVVQANGEMAWSSPIWVAKWVAKL